MITQLRNSLALIAAVTSAASPAFALGASPILVAQADLSDVPPMIGAPAIDAMDLGDLVAANTATRRAAPVRAGRTSTARPTPSAVPARTSNRPDPNFARANKLAANGQYQEASKLLFQMSRSPNYIRNSAQIKYVLGLMLFEMKLNQSAAFVFYDLIRQETKENPKSRFIRQSLEKLAIAADALDSDVLLKYAIKQVDENEFPPANRDMLYYRTGEVKMGENNFMEAARQFSRVRTNSQFFNRARYNMGLALSEAKDLEKAQAVFEDLADRTKDLGVTDVQHVSALMGRARVLYQRNLFAGAIEAYRDIPRDTEEWHESLFESSWAMLRDGRFRSALSNFHSLHSPFYDDFYQPESVLLRAITYLYICRNEEMSKTLDLFDRVYKPIQRDMRTILSGNEDPNIYYRELAKIKDQFDNIRANRVGRRGFVMPFSVARQILKEGDVRRTFDYIAKLDEERKRIDSLPSTWKTSGIGIYSRKIVEKRLEATRVLAGKQIKRHLIIMDNELRDLFEQSGFLRFEMLNSKREALKKEIQGKKLSKVDQDTERSYYVQNGYEYWPFKGEYWLDEIGNYHYVGVSACE